MKRASKLSDEPTVSGGRFADAMRVDGNAAAGILSELFVPDLTSARAKCGGCGMTRTIGAGLRSRNGNSGALSGL
jgi:hypothetical protein